VKYNYCPKCDKAYVKSHLEKDVCIYCGGRCETVEVRRSGLYYIGYAVTLAGSICIFMPNNVKVSEPLLFIIGGIGLVAIGILLVLKGSANMAAAAKEKVMAQEAEE
jgi:hypothetical protein